MPSLRLAIIRVIVSTCYKMAFFVMIFSLRDAAAAAVFAAWRASAAHAAIRRLRYASATRLRVARRVAAATLLPLLDMALCLRAATQNTDAMTLHIAKR